ncbi:unnamed protein product [Rotaria sordida]|uniref:Uncharacterized protein n=1 Tax=Rotaria sordida TaxID=392033 RepID=A0A819PKB7_9BILA|nr:unnamed protein product [Rotaria sordida]CAF4015788.1 unnamed protein product [Rotaria sordida]
MSSETKTTIVIVSDDEMKRVQPTKRDDVVEINCTTDQQQKVEKFLVNVKKHFNVKDVKIVDADSSKKNYYIQFETPFEAKMVKMMNLFAEEFSAILKDGSELSII